MLFRAIISNFDFLTGCFATSFSMFSKDDLLRQLFRPCCLAFCVGNGTVALNCFSCDANILFLNYTSLILLLLPPKE